MKKNYLLLLLISPIILVAQITTITSTEPLDLSVYNGTSSAAGQGEYQIFLGNDNILDKPIIFVDGFDPGDTRDIATIYNSLEFTGSTGTQNLGDLVRLEGFDIVILNFPTYVNGNGETIDGGADFIDRNAMVLVELINTINIAKASNNPEKNVIIGPSMGGIISRYSLNYMEANSQDADTRLFISFDSPHLGANIPIGLQHQLNYLAFNSLSPIAEAQPLINDLLNSPAARQLLLDHFEPHLASGSDVEFNPSLTLPIPHPYRTELMNRINGFTSNGFPQSVRNVAIVNGSGSNNPYFALGDSGNVVINGFPILDSEVTITVPNPLFPLGPPTFDVDIIIDVSCTPGAGSPGQVSSFSADTPFAGTITSTASSGTTNFDGVDAAPGGLFDISGLTGNIPPTGPAADVLGGLTIDKFNFIPTVSALALEITEEVTGDDINWFHNINLTGRATTNNTPFSNTFLPVDNEQHVELTEANVNFALTEILNPPLSTTNYDLFDVALEKNPINKELILLTNFVGNANLEISDLTGKIVFNKSIYVNNRTIIPTELGSGFYILNVLDKNNKRHVIKFLSK